MAIEIKISVDDLRKKKVFVGLPCYGGMMTGMCTQSLMNLQGLCQQYGVDMRISFLFNESLITRARNYLVDEFLRAESPALNPNFDPGRPESKENPKTIITPYTHLLFIDSDIHFDAKDVFSLLALDKDVIGAPYPKKTIKWGSIREATFKHANWQGIREAILQNPGLDNQQLADIAGEKNKSIDASDLDKLVGDFVFNPILGTKNFDVTEPVQVMEIGTGFMLIKREVFDQFCDKYPEKKYRPDHVGQAQFDGSRHIHAYFDCEIDRNPDGSGSERYLSEDYLFCQKVRKMGREVWLCPWMQTHHIGTYAFTGNMVAHAAYLGKL